MGKKAKYKQLRRLAAQMPEMNKQDIVGERRHGYELIKEDGINTIRTKDGEKPVDKDGMYSRKKVIERPLNHYKRMKDAFKKFGVQGVQAYGMAVNRRVAEEKAKATELIPAGEKVEKEVIS